ncbi:Hypothetical predicted protein [Podarcis lilfordi]|uniref:Uncharacterized protein n=1 Tax=Podarcis lilfordi TaxID=74358 RepID=A0AA35K5V8_9SAUR|nr:Hypothetical predicted protein [Podarcis lilfordi]
MEKSTLIYQFHSSAECKAQLLCNPPGPSSHKVLVLIPLVCYSSTRMMRTFLHDPSPSSIIAEFGVLLFRSVSVKSMHHSYKFHEAIETWKNRTRSNRKQVLETDKLRAVGLLLGGN